MEGLDHAIRPRAAWACAVTSARVDSRGPGSADWRSALPLAQQAASPAPAGKALAQARAVPCSGQGTVGIAGVRRASGAARQPARAAPGRGAGVGLPSGTVRGSQQMGGQRSAQRSAVSGAASAMSEAGGTVQGGELAHELPTARWRARILAPTPAPTRPRGRCLPPKASAMNRTAWR